LFSKPLAIVHSVEECLGHPRNIDKVTQFLSGIKSFVVEGIKNHSDLIAKSFEILENVHMMGTHTKSFKYILASDLQHDENFFLNHVAKVSNAIKDLEGPPMIKGFMLISPDELDIELSKLKDKWSREFDDLSYFSKDNMHTWTIDYVNLTNNIYINIVESCESLIQVERDNFEMKIKQEIIVPPLWDFISGWLEKQLEAIVETS
jgi:hypothetical protein